MSWTIAVITQSCSRPFVDVPIDVLDHYCCNAILLQTICECAVDVLDHYSHHTILLQTIPGWAVILDSHSHDTILFQTMCRSQKKLPRPPLNVMWACHYICVISFHCCRPSLECFNTTVICVLYRVIVTHSFPLDLFYSPESLHKWLGCSGVIFFTCQTREIV